jgi:uncharacterized membrane protein YdjX (TVP38/TMEM64 family)
MKQRLLTLLQFKLLKQGILFVSFCLMFGLLLSSSSLFESLNQDWIDGHIRNNGLMGVVNFILIASVATALGSPRQLLAFLGGYAFGFVNGALYSTLACTLGCALSFYFARFLARPWVKRRYPHKIVKVNSFLQKQTFSKTIIIRLLPVGSNLITNLVAGVTDIRARHFIAGSLLGYIPQMAIFALMGKGIVVLSVWKIVLSILLFIISSILSLRLYKQYKTEKLLAEDGNEDASDSQPPSVIR